MQEKPRGSESVCVQPCRPQESHPRDVVGRPFQPMQASLSRILRRVATMQEVRKPGTKTRIGDGSSHAIEIVNKPQFTAILRTNTRFISRRLSPPAQNERRLLALAPIRIPLLFLALRSLFPSTIHHGCHHRPPIQARPRPTRRPGQGQGQELGGCQRGSAQGCDGGESRYRRLACQSRTPLLSSVPFPNADAKRMSGNLQLALRRHRIPAIRRTHPLRLPRSRSRHCATGRRIRKSRRALRDGQDPWDMAHWGVHSRD